MACCLSQGTHGFEDTFALPVFLIVRAIIAPISRDLKPVLRLLHTLFVLKLPVIMGDACLHSAPTVTRTTREKHDEDRMICR
jgi:hypothetical protein